MIGSELFLDSSLTRLQKWYCRFFGVPIVGLRIRWRRLSKLLPRTAGVVLDAGCGRGVITRALALRYPNAIIIGLDSDSVLQDRNREIAARSGHSACRFEQGDLAQLQEASRFDLIVSVDNLEHIQDDVVVLRNLYSALAPGGQLLIHVPHYYRRWPLFRWTVNFDVPGHVRPGYHLPELRERLAQAEFTVESIGFSYGFLENLANSASYAITGARERNKALYSLVFPILNAISWLGHRGNPKMGAGVWAVASKLEKAQWLNGSSTAREAQDKGKGDAGSRRPVPNGDHH